MIISNNKLATIFVAKIYSNNFQFEFAALISSKKLQQQHLTARKFSNNLQLQFAALINSKELQQQKLVAKKISNHLLKLVTANCGCKLLLLIVTTNYFCRF